MNTKNRSHQNPRQLVLAHALGWHRVGLGLAEQSRAEHEIGLARQSRLDQLRQRVGMVAVISVEKYDNSRRGMPLVDQLPNGRQAMQAAPYPRCGSATTLGSAAGCDLSRGVAGTVVSDNHTPDWRHITQHQRYLRNSS